MKALEILKILHSHLKYSLYTPEQVVDTDGVYDEKNKNCIDIEEAIAELEELQNRSCENCNGSIKIAGFNYCEKGSSPLSSCAHALHPTFCCNRYEPKNK